MSTTPKSGWRYPASSAAPNVPLDLQNLATDLDWVGANFATTSARDAAIPTPATGDQCRVVGRPQYYPSGGPWEYVQSGAAIQSIDFSPGSTTDTDAAGGTWLTLGNVVVPAWATTASVNVTFEGIFAVTGIPVQFNVAVKIGTASTVVRAIHDPGVLTTRFSVPLLGKITSGLSSGTKSVTIVSTRTIGSSALRADTGTQIGFLVIFQ